MEDAVNAKRGAVNDKAAQVVLHRSIVRLLDAAGAPASPEDEAAIVNLESQIVKSKSEIVDLAAQLAERQKQTAIAERQIGGSHGQAP